MPIACGPRLVGVTKETFDRVLYTFTDTVRGKRPFRPSPRCELMEEAF